MSTMNTCGSAQNAITATKRKPTPSGMLKQSMYPVPIFVQFAARVTLVEIV